MDTLYRTSLFIHVSCGALGLAVMLVPLLARKGARVHRRFGWLFVSAMSVVALTGVVMALSWLIAPARFRPDAAAPEVLLDATFLTLIGALTANSLAQASFALRQKGQARAVPTILVKVLLAFLATCALISVWLGLRYGDALSLVFGVASLLLLIQDVRFSSRAFASPHAYLYQHIGAMGRACIAVVTAFLVLGARRWLGADVLGSHAWLLWIAPTLLLAPVFHLWIGRYRRALGRPLATIGAERRPLTQHA
jgi:hypothetical protein